MRQQQKKVSLQFKDKSTNKWYSSVLTYRGKVMLTSEKWAHPESVGFQVQI